MARVLVPVAPGTEELEAVTIIDLLRRAGVEVVVAGLEPGPIKCSRGVVLVPDALLSDVIEQEFDLIALPGGAEGSRRLAASEVLRQALQTALAAGKRVAAVCAAPEALRQAGLLEGRRVTSYPGSLPADDPSYTYVEDSVVVDGPVTTSRGPGTSMDFALSLMEQLVGRDKRQKVEHALMRPPKGNKTK
jgi:protein deglycase